MRPQRVSAITAATGGRCLRADGDVLVTGVSTDTRTLKPGDVFVALRGPNFDGHAFIDAAIAAGAAAVIAENTGPLPPPSGRGTGHLDAEAPGRCSGPIPVILVEDTARALGDMAKAYRRTLPATVVAVTGSNGKTTTKEMILRILAGQRVPGANTSGAPGPQAVGSIKSFNNHIGVPLTLFDAEPTHRWVVVEMGTNHPGEIARLAEIAAPDVGVVTNISEAHLEGLGSREGVAAAKAELIEALPAQGSAVLYADDPLCASMAGLGPRHVITFGQSPSADLFATDIRQTAAGVAFRLNGRRRVRLKVLGEHNALNALAAAAACRRLGLDEDEVVAGLEAFVGTTMRLTRREADGVTILDDSYNANPGSMRRALGTCACFPCTGRRVFVCGGMAELGPESHRLHRDLGRRVVEEGIDLLVTVGADAAYVGRDAAAGMTDKNVHTCEMTDEAVDLVPGLLKTGDLVLVKGSRVYALERVVGAIVAARAAGPEGPLARRVVDRKGVG